MSLVVISASHAENIDGPWLIDNMLFDERGNQWGSQSVVFFSESEDGLKQNSIATGKGGDAELVSYARLGETGFNLTNSLSIVTFAESRIFDTLVLGFASNSMTMNGTLTLGDRSYTYQGSGKPMNAVTIDPLVQPRITNLSGKSDDIPRLYTIEVPENTAGLKVTTIDTAEPLTRVKGGDIKLYLVNGTTIIGSQRIDFLNSFEHEVGSANPEAGTWYVLVETGIEYEDVDLLVEIGDGLDIPVIPVNPGNPTDPGNPSNPSNPLDPGDPTNPADPADPASPSDPTVPVDVADPTDPSDPNDPVIPVDIIKPHVGWWWNTSQSGSGYSIEFQTDSKAENKHAIFFGGYFYEEDGTPVWATALLEPVENSPNSYKGSLLEYRHGTTLESTTYLQPRLVGTYGVVNLTVANENSIELNWPGGVVTLEPFQFDTESAQNTLESGWWWNPFTPGQGYFLEQQGDMIYFVSYLYNQDGDAVWYAAWLSYDNSVKKDSPELAGRLLRVSGGQPLGGEYAAPSAIEDLGQVTIDLQTSNIAIIDWPGGKQSLQRFYFRK